MATVQVKSAPTKEGRNTSPSVKLGLVSVAFFAVLSTATTMGHAAPAHTEAPNTLIQISVEVVEVDQNKTQDLGVAWNQDIQFTEAAVAPVFNVGAFARSQLAADVHFLLQEGAADMLANPKLVTRDSTTATFHAGGELPYAVSGSLGTASVQFKPYGVNLKINPHVNPEGRIVLSVDAEISGPDDSNTVTLSGNVVPGIRSRQISSQLTLEPGSTLTLAGLIQTQKQWTRTGVPGLMHIPVLGYLFSHKSLTDQKTSIVVFLTPTILNAESGAATHNPSLVPKLSDLPRKFASVTDSVDPSGDSHE